MNVNIQSIATNNTASNQTMPIQNAQPYTNQNINTNVSNNVINNQNNNQGQNGNYNRNTNTGNQNSSYVKKTYVTTDDKPKKKNIQLNLGPEFKIALLIMVILLVFIFLLPKISDILNGY